MNENSLAQRCQELFESASQRLDALLWNGEYFEQQIEDIDAHKYQHGKGCLSDQLLGQLHAQLLGLGDLLPRQHIHAAIKAVYDHNFREDFSDHMNCQRSYVLNDEAGLLMCTWPKGGRPTLPFVYSDEVWTGVEYHVAAHLMAEGWSAEGLRIVQAVRDRHNGDRRNPWDEVECGHHYARSMSSWTLLLALSGFHADLGQNTMSFSPLAIASTDPERFATFWSNGKSWGVFSQHRTADGDAWTYELDVRGGEVDGLQIYANGERLPS
jgi:uncharacterized protein (DUF608 family)